MARAAVATVMVATATVTEGLAAAGLARAAAATVTEGLAAATSLHY